MKKANLVLLPGDGIGPEVVAQAQQVLERIATRFGHTFAFSTHLIGGAAIDATGGSLPKATGGAGAEGDGRGVPGVRRDPSRRRGGPEVGRPARQGPARAGAPRDPPGARPLRE